MRNEPARKDGLTEVANKRRICYSFLVVLRTCTVAVKDNRDVEHSIEVTAETLYEAIATALAALQQDNWVGEIGQGFTTVTVVVQQLPVKHGQNEGLCLMARTPRTFSCRSHPEAKAGENIA
jgi:hypothetical protein